MLATELGPGVLALIPDSLISKTWLANGLNDGQFDIWVQMIKRFNPDCITLSEKVRPRVEAAFSAKRIPSRRIKLDITSGAELRATKDKSTLLDKLQDGRVTSDEETDSTKAICGPRSNLTKAMSEPVSNPASMSGYDDIVLFDFNQPFLPWTDPGAIDDMDSNMTGVLGLGSEDGNLGS